MNSLRKKRLSVDEIEEIYGISRRRLVTYIKKGKLKGHKINGQAYQIDEDELKEFIKKNKQVS